MTKTSVATSPEETLLLKAVNPGIRRQALRALPMVTLMGLALAALLRLQIDFRAIVPGIGKLGWLAGLMWPPSVGAHLPEFLGALAETLGIAFLGVLLAAAAGFALSLMAARTMSPAPFVRVVARRLLDVLRGIDVLIWAMVFVSAVGLGPFKLCTTWKATFARRRSWALSAREALAFNWLIESG
ncbi:MAG: hypothetical protein MUF01_06320 [Bryobacterales bacterium]|nr:hypothetical protein [Bryobacterales bacterium]